MIERWGRRRFAVGWSVTLFITLMAVLPPLVAIAASMDSAATESWSAGPYHYVMSTYGSSLFLSARLAAMVVLLSIFIGTPAAYAFVRLPFPGSRLLETLSMTPLALPGVAVAIAVMLSYSALRGHLLLLASAQMLYTVPYVVRIVSNTLRAGSLDDLHAAARTLGASPWQRFGRITFPSLRHPLLIASLMVFAIAWGEFNVAFLLATPLQMPFPAALYATYTSNSAAVSGAATAIFLAGALPFLVALQFVEGVTFERGQGV